MIWWAMGRLRDVHARVPFWPAFCRLLVRLCFLCFPKVITSLPHCLLTSVAQGPFRLPYPTSLLHNCPGSVLVPNLLSVFSLSGPDSWEKGSAYLLMPGLLRSLVCLLVNKLLSTVLACSDWIHREEEGEGCRGLSTSQVSGCPFPWCSWKKGPSVRCPRRGRTLAFINETIRCDTS